MKQQKKVQEWVKEHGKSDAEIMMVLGLTSVNQYKHRLLGITRFTPLERRVLSEYTGVPEDELFED